MLRGINLTAILFAKWKKNIKAAKCVDDRRLIFLKKRMPRIAGLIACEWVERSFDHGEGLLRFFFFLEEERRIKLNQRRTAPPPSRTRANPPQPAPALPVFASLPLWNAWDPACCDGWKGKKKRKGNDDGLTVGPRAQTCKRMNKRRPWRHSVAILCQAAQEKYHVFNLLLWMHTKEMQPSNFL